MRTRRLLTALAFILGTLATLALLWLLATPPQAARAQAGTGVIRVATTGGDAPGCGGSANPCATVQYAVDLAAAGDEIRVATGVYSDVNTYGGSWQVVYISKTLTVRGGYTTTGWSSSNPISYPTTLDAQGGGRVLYIRGDISVTLAGLRVTGGDAYGLGGGQWGRDAGGGVYVMTATVTINNNQVFSNTARDGGGLYLSNSADAMLTHNTISYNRLFGWYPRAAGLLFYKSPRVTLDSNTISNNVADVVGAGQKHYGGVLFDLSDNATLINNTISGNYAANICGGACFDSSDNATMISNVVISNTAKQPGGDVVGYGAGLHFSDSKYARLIDNTICYNSGKENISQGIIFGGGLAIRSNSSVALTANRIYSNAATKGGGLFLESGIVTLTANIITSNSAHDSITTPVGFDPAGDGGGIYLNDGSATLVNSIIADNQAETAGSGLYIQDASPWLLHTTIARNGSASLTPGGDAGSGVYITGTASSVVMTNTILVSHSVGITVAADSAARLEATLWGSGRWANDRDWGGAGTVISGEINLWGDPAFTCAGDACGAPYRIEPGSEAIDEGVNVSVTVDIDGEPRPAGVGYDIGADELSYPALEVTKRADPDPVQAGAPLTYTIRVTNTGNVTLTATITDVLPEHVTPSGVRTWTQTIPFSNGVWSQAVVVSVALGYAGPLTNVVQVGTEEGVTGIYTETAQAQVRPALSVTKRATPGLVQAGSPLTYAIRVTNTGNVTLTAIITDVLPEHVVPSGVLTRPANLAAAGGVWTWQFAVTVAADYSGTLVNKVQVSALEGATGVYSATCSVFSPVWHLVYLPLLLKNTP